jgi:hypothetical protein
MKKIMMAKYGFVRCPEEDFSDDGNRFQTYKVGRVRVTKLVSDGEAYIDGDINDGKLPYEVYSKLPHYALCGKLNGISLAALTDEDLQELYEDCVAYGREYTDTENSVVYPTLDEIKEKAVKVTAKSLVELTKVEMLLKNYGLEAVAKFSPYEWKTVQEYTKHLLVDVQRFDPETFPQTVVGKSYSFDFVKPETHMEESYWFTYLKELFGKYCMKA